MAARRVALVAAIVAIAIAVGATAYVFRSHLGGVPLIGRLLRSRFVPNKSGRPPGYSRGCPSPESGRQSCPPHDTVNGKQR